MGKKFESPAIVSLSLEDTEGILTGRGSGDEPTDDFRFVMKYGHHNTGHLSTIEIYIYNVGQTMKENIKLTLMLTGGLTLDPKRPSHCNGQALDILSDTMFKVYVKGEPMHPNANPKELCLEMYVLGGPTKQLIGEFVYGAMDTDASSPVKLQLVDYEAS